jgi:hypothetical protein
VQRHTRSPAIEQLTVTVKELKILNHRLRQAHDRAKDISARQQREMRGKVDPHSTKRVQDNTGSVAKVRVLFDAIKRVEDALLRRDYSLIEICLPISTTC